MKLAHVASGNGVKVAAISGGFAYDVGGALGGARTIDDLISRGELGALAKSKDLASGRKTRLADVKLRSPILSPEKILLAAVNYRAHGKEQDVKPPSAPYFFTKFRNTVIGDGDPILVPKNSEKVDWEVELAVVIGKKGKYIPKSKAMDYVAGYAVSNDVSFRDLQFPPGWPKTLSPLGQNWVLGKGLDNSFPLGPCLVTADELDDVGDLELTLKVNGKVKQKASTSDMIFKVPALIVYLSQGMTLMPGDVISTGTPQGVAVFTGEPFLKDGDLVEASVSGIGTLHNPVKRG